MKCSTVCQQRCLLESFVLTSLGDDASGDNNDDGPVELCFKMLDDLLANFAECGNRSVGDLYYKHLAKGAILLFVFNEFSTVDPDLAQMFLQGSVVELELGKHLSGFILKFSWLLLFQGR